MAEVRARLRGGVGAGDEAVVGHLYFRLVLACPEKVESDGQGKVLGY